MIASQEYPHCAQDKYKSPTPITDTDGHSGALDCKIPSISTTLAIAEAVGSSQIGRSQVHIPMEIVDQILDCLCADESCLQNCALVCKSWASCCRRNLFYQVVWTDNTPSFRAWQRSISVTPNGPHLYVRKLSIPNCYFKRRYHPSPDAFDAFLQHWSLFTNVGDLYIGSNLVQNSLDNMSIHDTFSHLSGTLRSLTIIETRCSPQALMTLIALFQHLELLDLTWISFDSSQLPLPLPERRTFKGTFRFADWRDSSEEFVTLLSEHDLQYHKMRVSGEYWLQDTGWNKCLAKCADHLEEFSIVWTRKDGKCVP